MFVFIYACNLSMERFWRELQLCSLEAFQSKLICKDYDHTKFWTHLFTREHGCSLDNLSPCSPCTWFPREGALFLGELRHFLMENSLFPDEIVFFPLRTFLSPWGTCLGLSFSLFFLEQVPCQGQLTYKNLFICLMDFFIHFIYW